MENSKFYTKGEEIANAITHGIGSILSIAALVLLIIFSSSKGTIWHVVGFTVFGITLMIMYIESTLYHSLTNKKAKNFFKTLDYSSKYLLIAGTYTPYTLTILRSAIGWVIFGAIWGLAIIGIVAKSWWLEKYDKLATLIYVLMGWVIIISLNTLVILLPIKSLLFFIIGGILYTLGSILYTFDKLPYTHAVWHILVVAGSVSHFFSIIFMLFFI